MIVYRDCREPKINNCKSQLLMKMKLGRYCTLVDVEITGLQKMLKVYFLCLETQADIMLHARKCCRQHGRRNFKISLVMEMVPTGKAGTGSVLPNFVFIINYCMIYNY
jgi:hypothetical protein